MIDQEVMGKLLQNLEHVDPDSNLYKNFVAELLCRIDPNKPFGTALFNAIAKYSWSVAFEAVALRVRSGGEEVFLRKRAADDPAYPGEWHAPGSVFRPGECERDVANRLEQEFGVPVASFQKVGEYIDWEKGEARGSFISWVYIVQLQGEPREDDRHGWYSVDHLPEVMVDSHRMDIIPMAVQACSARRRIHH